MLKESVKGNAKRECIKETLKKNAKGNTKREHEKIRDKNIKNP